MPTYYERDALFKADNGETYQLFRGFTYKGKSFFNLINAETGRTRVSDLSRYIATPRNAVSIEELEQQYAPLKFTHIGSIRDYVLLPKKVATTTPTPPPQREPSLLDEIYTLIDAI